MSDAERALANEMRVGISETHQVFVEVSVRSVCQASSRDEAGEPTLRDPTPRVVCCVSGFASFVCVFIPEASTDRTLHSRLDCDKRPF